ncbi:MAG: YjbQ family protein [Cyanobium sp.]
MLRQSQHTLNFISEGLLKITAELNRALISSGMQQGQACLLCLQTSCSLTINENSDSRVLTDLSAHLQALVPEEGFRSLSGRGPLRPTCTTTRGPTTCPPISAARSPAATSACPSRPADWCWAPWQAIYLWEHRFRPQRRQRCIEAVQEASRLAAGRGWLR